MPLLSRQQQKLIERKTIFPAGHHKLCCKSTGLHYHLPSSNGVERKLHNTNNSTNNIATLLPLDVVSDL